MEPTATKTKFATSALCKIKTLFFFFTGCPAAGYSVTSHYVYCVAGLIKCETSVQIQPFPRLCCCCTLCFFSAVLNYGRPRHAVVGTVYLGTVGFKCCFCPRKASLSFQPDRTQITKIPLRMQPTAGYQVKNNILISPLNFAHGNASFCFNFGQFCLSSN